MIGGHDARNADTPVSDGAAPHAWDVERRRRESFTAAEVDALLADVAQHVAMIDAQHDVARPDDCPLCARAWHLATIVRFVDRRPPT
jgi:hypothetical protein